MNRRAFLKSLVTAAATVAVSIDNVDEIVEQLLQETATIPDTEFIAYIQVTMQMWVSNPAHCAIINGIDWGTSENDS